LNIQQEERLLFTLLSPLLGAGAPTEQDNGWRLGKGIAFPLGEFFCYNPHESNDLRIWMRQCLAQAQNLLVCTLWQGFRAI